jgi:hypothetical protein
MASTTGFPAASICFGHFYLLRIQYCLWFGWQAREAMAAVGDAARSD